MRNMPASSDISRTYLHVAPESLGDAGVGGRFGER